MTADKLLALARGEIGTTEYPKGSNKVKYNTDYYGREVSGSGYPWCCVFVWWLFRQSQAAPLFFGGGKTAYCPALLEYHKKQWVKDGYRPGDVIFFNFWGRSGASHVGLCEAWDGKNITTIDGNTGTGNEANGGAVMRRTRDKKYIVGAYRPAYREEESLTQLQFDNLMANWLARQSERPESPWGKMAEAKRAGITDGSRPQSFATREEVATMIVSAKI